MWNVEWGLPPLCIGLSIRVTLLLSWKQGESHDRSHARKNIVHKNKLKGLANTVQSKIYLTVISNIRTQ